MFCGIAFNRPGSDLLSRVLRRSTIGAGAFHGRVRNGNGCGRPAMTTRSIKGNEPTFLLACDEKLAGIACFLFEHVFLALVCVGLPIQASGRRQSFGAPSAA